MKYLKWILIAVAAIFLIGFLAIKLVSEKEPQGFKGTEADQLAKDMLTALNKDGFDELAYLQWTFFRGEHHYRWDKKNNVAEIVWDDKKVIMQLDSKEANVYVGQAPVIDTFTRNTHINKAWEYWCNDSFWLIAPFKVFDPGTSRSIVEENGKKQLKIEYHSGGVTPGDSYLYELNDKNIPVSWKMWTKILPVKGFETSWDKWVELPGGGMISTFHSNSLIDMQMNNVKGGNSLSALGWKEDIFKYN